MNTFPPAAPAASQNAVQRFRPDAYGNPPAGWAWLGAASYEDGANYGPTDMPISPAGEQFWMGTSQVVQSNQAYMYYVASSELNTFDSVVSYLSIAWPAGFVATRLVAACMQRDELGTPSRLVLLAKGALDAADALAAQVYAYDGESSSWVLAHESTADCATIGRNVADRAQAFAFQGDHFFVRSIAHDTGFETGYIAVDAATAAIVPLAAAGSLASSIVASRIIAADGLLAAVTNPYDRLVRGRLFVLDTVAGTVSATAAVFAAVGFDGGDVSGYDRAAPEYALGFAPGDGSLIVSTEAGMSRLVNESGVLRAFQVAGPHPLVRAAAGPVAYPQRFASFCAATMLGVFGNLRYVGAQGAAVSNGGLEISLASYLGTFSRLAYKL